MRFGLAFVALFALLVTVYLLLADTLGGPATFALQAGIVLMVVGAAQWLRRARSVGGWQLFSDESHAPAPEPDQAESEEREEDHQVPRAR